MAAATGPATAGGLLVDASAIPTPPVTGRTKGLPPGLDGIAFEDIGRQGWNVLRQDLPLPACVLKRSALEHNLRWMRRFMERTGAVLAPHGKTYMSPELFAMQLGAGAWGMTISTTQQARVCRDLGIRRLLMANQLVDPVGIRWVLDELEADPDFEFYCLVDSERGVEILERAARDHGGDRAIGALVEVGFDGGRTGVRDLETGLRVARAAAAADRLELRGVEAFEGLLMFGSPDEQIARVDAFLQRVVEVAAACDAEGLFGEEVILSAGGSAFFDRVVDALGNAGLRSHTTVVNRSGCYLTHDSAFYRDAHHRIHERSEDARALGEGLREALEIWTWVQSRPQPDLAILTMGKREAGYDMGWPLPRATFRPGRDAAPVPMPPGHTLRTMNDQHAHLDVPPDSPLQVGDMVMCGISHPCLTFDRWAIMLVVEDDYTVTGAIRTFF